MLGHLEPELQKVPRRELRHLHYRLPHLPVLLALRYGGACGRQQTDGRERETLRSRHPKG